jgi:hypothetical protein
MQIKTTMRNHLTSARILLSKQKKIINAGKDVEKRKSLHTIGGNLYHV